MKILAVFLLAAMIAIGATAPAEDNDEVCAIESNTKQCCIRNIHC